jgi:exopolysaccharide biosynthesis WecB/TagA/CpsF family protein
MSQITAMPIGRSYPVPVLAPVRERPAQPIVRVANVLINIRDPDDAIARVIADAALGIGGTLFTLNLDHLVKLEQDPAFRAAYDRASYITADGVPIVTMARGAGVAISRVTGSDLVEPMCRAAATAGIPVHFFGTSNVILETARARLEATVPGLRIAGLESPPFGFDPTGAAAVAAAERIAQSGAKICFVALGAPKQELFADVAASVAPGVLFLGIGAALDFIAGAQKRAPRVLSNAGFEWLWRLAQDPRRLGPRYARSALFFTRYILGRLGSSSSGTAHPKAGASSPGLRETDTFK